MTELATHHLDSNSGSPQSKEGYGAKLIERIEFWTNAIPSTNRVIIDMFPKYSTVTELTPSLLQQMRDDIEIKCTFFNGAAYPHYFTETEYRVGNCISYANIASNLCSFVGGKNCVIPFNLEGMHIVTLVWLTDGHIYYFDPRGKKEEEYLFQIEPEMLTGENDLAFLNEAFASPNEKPVHIELNLSELPAKTPFLNERQTGKMWGSRNLVKFFMSEYLEQDAHVLLKTEKVDNAHKAYQIIEWLVDNSPQGETCRNSLGYCLFVLNRNQEAIEMYKQSLRVLPNQPYTLSWLKEAQLKKSAN